MPRQMVCRHCGLSIHRDDNGVLLHTLPPDLGGFQQCCPNQGQDGAITVAEEEPTGGHFNL